MATLDEKGEPDEPRSCHAAGRRPRDRGHRLRRRMRGRQDRRASPLAAARPLTAVEFATPVRGGRDAAQRKSIGQGVRILTRYDWSGTLVI